MHGSQPAQALLNRLCHTSWPGCPPSNCRLQLALNPAELGMAVDGLHHDNRPTRDGVGASMLRALWLSLLVLIALPAARRSTGRRNWRKPREAYRKELLDRYPGNKRQPALIPRLRRDAEAEYRAKRYPQAIDDLTQAIGYGADDGLVWLRLAQALDAAPQRAGPGRRLQRLRQVDRPGRTRQRAVPDRPRFRPPREVQGSARRCSRWAWR